MKELEFLKSLPNFKPYIEKIISLASKKIEKDKIKNIVVDEGEYKKLSDTIKEKIEPFIKKQEKKIEEKIKEDYIFINDKYKKIGQQIADNYETNNLRAFQHIYYLTVPY